MTVQDVIRAARSRLGDTDSTGWSDNRLLEIINNGQRDMCRRASIYRRMVIVDLANGISHYTLPDDCYNITRLERAGKQLPIYSREDIERVRTIPHTYAVKSNLNRSEIEVFPIPDDISEFDEYVEGTTLPANKQLKTSLGVVTGANTSLGMQQSLGVVTRIHDVIECNPPSKYGEIADIGVNTAIKMIDLGLGVVTGVNTKPLHIRQYGFLESVGTTHTIGTYGLCTHTSFSDNYITVYYDAVPPLVKWVNSSLYIEDLWLNALVHYVVGIARQDDNDEGNYQIGEAEIGKYEEEVVKARKISAKSFNSQVGVVREVIYRRL